MAQSIVHYKLFDCVYSMFLLFLVSFYSWIEEKHFPAIAIPITSKAQRKLDFCNESCVVSQSNALLKAYHHPSSICKKFEI